MNVPACDEHCVAISIVICQVVLLIVSMWQGSVFRSQKEIDSEKCAQTSIVAKKIVTHYEHEIQLRHSFTK